MREKEGRESFMDARSEGHRVKKYREGEGEGEGPNEISSERVREQMNE